MSIENVRQLENTKAKLILLQEGWDKLKQRPDPNPYVDELTRKSLQGEIKQLKEEIVRYEMRVAAPVSSQ